MGKEPHEMTVEEYVMQQDALPLGQGLPHYEYRKAVVMALDAIGSKTVDDPGFDAAYESAIRKLRVEHATWQHGSLVKKAKLEAERAGAALSQA